MTSIIGRSLLAACLSLVLGQACAAPDDGLEAALNAALGRHPAVSGKQAEVQAAAFGVDAARSQRYPTLGASTQRFNRGASGLPVSVTARQPLWAFGRIDANIAYAKADEGAEQADLLRVRRGLVENTAVAYATVLGARARLRVARNSIEAHQDFYQQIVRREKGQLASRADVSLAATRLAQEQARAQRIEGELDIALSDLLALTQAPVAAEQPVDPRYTDLPPAAEGLELALAGSADVRSREALITRAGAEVDVAKTASRPTVYLQAETVHGQPGLRSDNRLGVVIEGSLEGLGLAARGRANAARSRLDAAREDLASARNEVGRTVRRLYASRAMQQELVKAQRASLGDLGGLIESYKRQYAAGTKSWLDVLNMQRELTEQQLALAQSENDWLASSLQLMAVTGSLDRLAGIDKE